MSYRVGDSVIVTDGPDAGIIGRIVRIGKYGPVVRLAKYRFGPEGPIEVPGGFAITFQGGKGLRPFKLGSKLPPLQLRIDSVLGCEGKADH